MSTIIFNGATPGVVYGGGVPDGSQFVATPNSFGGELIQQAVGTNAELRCNFKGPSCDVYVYASGNTWSWTIDGGATQTAAPSGSNMQWMNVATGLSDTFHTLVLKPIQYFVGWDQLLRVTGSSPAITAPSGYGNPQFGFPSSGVTRDNSAYRTGSVEGYVGLTDHGSCRFKATTPEIKIWCRYDLDSPIGLVVDDDITTLVRVHASSTWGWVTFSGLDSGAEHSYRFIIPSGVYFYNFMAAGLNTTALTPYPADYWMGDSITVNSTLTNGDAAPSYWTYYAIKAKRGWQIQAQAGATAATQGVAWKTYPGLASPTPDRVVLAFGTNDLGNAESSATWTSAITTILTQINADLPTKKIVWLGLFDTTFNHTGRGTYNTDLSNTITSFGNPLVTYFSSDGAGLISTSDSVHFDASGSVTYGAYLYANLPGSSTTITASITQASLSLTAESLSPTVSWSVTISQASISLTAENLTGSLAVGASITQASLALTPETLPSVSLAAQAAITQGSLSLTAEQLPSVSLAASAAIAQGSLSLTPETISFAIVPASPPPPPGTITANIVQASLNLSAQQINPAASYGVSIAQGSLGLTAEPLPAVSLAANASIVQGTLGLTAEPISFSYVPSGNVAIVQASLTLTAFPINVQISSAVLPYSTVYLTGRNSFATVSLTGSVSH